MHVFPKITSFVVLLWASMAFATSTIPGSDCTTNLTGPTSATASVRTEVGASPVVDTIAAKIQISMRRKGESVATLVRPGQKLRDEYVGNGDVIVGSFATQTSIISPTTMRVEERAVVKATDVQSFLANTATSEFLKNQNGGQPVVWKIRDEASPGHQLVNLTVIGKFLTFELASGAQAGVKSRSRMYFEVPNNDRFNPEKYNPSNIGGQLGQLVAFELKFSSLEGPGDGSMLSHESSVFKPRFFYTKELDNRLRSITARNPNYLVELDEIKNEILALQLNGRPLNPPLQIEEDFAAIKVMLSKDPDFLLPVLVVKNARTAYEAHTKEGVYQFTADSDIEIFWAKPEINSLNVLQYLSAEALYRGGDVDNHVELKSPVSAVQQNLPIYKEMLNRITAAHLPNFKIGSGKFALAAYTQEKIGNQPIERTLLDFGTNFWLIKGTGQLSVLLKRNEVTEGKRMVLITIPFKAKNGHFYRMTLTYQPASGDVSTATADKSAVLKDITIRDRHDFKVEIDQKLAPFIISMLDRPSNDVIGLEVEGIVIPIKGKLTAAEHREYIEFMRAFYEFDNFFGGGERDAGVLAVVQTPGDLPRVVRRIKKDNTIQFWRERLTKAYPMLIMSMIGGAVAPMIPFADISNAVIDTARTQIERFYEPSPASQLPVIVTPAPKK